jgi:hypothetical protein
MPPLPGFDADDISSDATPLRRFSLIFIDAGHYAFRCRRFAVFSLAFSSFRLRHISYAITPFDAAFIFLRIFSPARLSLLQMIFRRIRCRHSLSTLL